MTEYIPVGSKVVIYTIEGKATGTVLSFRDTHLAELNPPQPEPPDKPNILNIPVVIPEIDLQRIITMYTVLLDDPVMYKAGPVSDTGTVEVYKFIRLASEDAN